MPARRKTTAETDAALQRLFAARDEWERNERMTWPLVGMEQTPGYTVARDKHGRRIVDPGKGFVYHHEPQVWVLQRRLNVEGKMQDADSLVTALWETLPKVERRRSRLFVHCGQCPVRFTKKGAMADAMRCDLRREQERKEKVSALVRSSIEPPRLVPKDKFEEGVALVWDDLSTLHRRTLYAWLRPADESREWALEGAPSPEAFTSRIRTAEKVVARALAARVFPDVDFSIRTRGRPGFDYERFWDSYLS